MTDPADAAWNEALAHLDAELHRLPDKYRVPLVLCELEGKSRKEAARLLGLPEGTVSWRLAQGRKTLARKLARYSGALPAGALTALACETASAHVPPALLSATVQAARHLAAGGAVAAGVISTSVLTLTDGVIKAMLLNKLKVVWLVVAAGFLGVGAAGWTYGAADAKPASEPPVAARVARDELDALRLEVEALRKLLLATRERVGTLESEVQTLKNRPGGRMGMGGGMTGTFSGGMAGMPGGFSGSVSTPAGGSLADQIGELELKKATLLIQHGANHPEVLKIEMQIKVLKDFQAKSIAGSPLGTPPGGQAELQRGGTPDGPPMGAQLSPGMMPGPPGMVGGPAGPGVMPGMQQQGTSSGSTSSSSANEFGSVAAEVRRELRIKLRDLEVKKAMLEVEYGAKHLEVQKIEQQIERTREAYKKYMGGASGGAAGPGGGGFGGAGGGMMAPGGRGGAGGGPGGGGFGGGGGMRMGPGGGFGGMGAASGTSSSSRSIRDLPAFRLEVMDMNDPIEVGATTKYKIEVHNQGSRPGNDVQIIATVPKEMQVLGGDGPTKPIINGQEVRFPPVDSLAEKQTLTYTVEVKALQPGDVGFMVRMFCATLGKNPIIERENTTINLPVANTPRDPAQQQPKRVNDALTAAEEALKKLRQQPNDKQAADQLEKALQRLKEPARPAGDKPATK
jgi:hypothetical protein